MIRINLRGVRNGSRPPGSARRARVAPLGGPMRNGGKPSDEEEDVPRHRLEVVAKHLLEEIQDYARRKPLEGLLISFLSGMVLSSLLRRDR